MPCFFLVAVIIVTLALGPPAVGQPSQLITGTELDLYRSRYGIVGAFSANQHDLRVFSIPDLFPCCQYTDKGNGSGYSIGALYEKPLNATFLLALRGTLTGLNGVISSIGEVEAVSAGQPTAVFADRRINVGMSAIVLEPLLSYRLTSGFLLSVGARVGFNRYSDISASESLNSLSGSAATFADGRRERLLINSDKSRFSGFGTWVLAGMGYEVPIDARRRFLFSPEILVSIATSPVLQNEDWTIGTMQVGLALKYAPEIAPLEKPLPPPPPPPPPPVNPPPVPAPMLSARLSVAASTRSGLPADTIVIQQLVQSIGTVAPILPYIFFEKGSSAIPERYRLVDANGAMSFADVLEREGTNSVDAYYHTLNIIGSRMRSNPGSSLTITGCRAADADEPDPMLSMERALTVATYLQKVWQIDAQRLMVTSQGLPNDASRSKEPLGIDENRRVEFSSASTSLLEPIPLVKTEISNLVTNALEFRPDVSAAGRIENWSLSLSGMSRYGTVASGAGAVPRDIVVPLTDTMIAALLQTDMLVGRLDVRDQYGQLTHAETQPLPVKTQFHRNTRLFSRTPDSIDKHLVVIFNYDKSNLNAEQLRIVQNIASEIDPNDSVLVVGYTDALGDDKRNTELSSARARAVAAAIGQSAEAVGLGESVQLFDNTLPEGRFYNRTVEIRIHRRTRPDSTQTKP